MKTRTINIRVGGVLVLLLLGLVGYLLILMYDMKEERTALQLGLFKNTQTLVRYIIEVDSLKEQVVEANLLVLHSDKALKESKEYAERLEALNMRRVYVIGQLELQLRVIRDSLPLLRPDTIIRYVEVENIITVDSEELIPRPMVEVPLEFGINDRWVVANASVTDLGLGRIDFHVKDAPITIALGSRGILKPSYVIAASSPNPYLHIDQSNFAIVKESKKKTIAYGAIGILVGVTTTLLLIQ